MDVVQRELCLPGEATARLADLAPDDIQRQVEQLARFKQAAVFRIATRRPVGPLAQVLTYTMHSDV